MQGTITGSAGIPTAPIGARRDVAVWAFNRSGRRPADDPARRAKGLGWFSIGLGLAELLGPSLVASIVGAREKPRTHRTLVGLGIREIASGVAILAQPHSSTWLWSRVVGDVVDLALLGRTLGSPYAHRGRTLAATAAVLGVTVLDAVTAVELSRQGESQRVKPTGIEILRSITIHRPVEEVYAFWRDFQNLPRFMEHLESVEVINGRSRWRAKAPIGGTVEWEAEILIDRPNEYLAWRSIEGSEIPNRGSVEFTPAPGGRGTEVRVELRYEPPAGKLGATFAKLFGEEPGQQIAGDLRRLKQVLETGEVVHSDASIHKGAHAAQPPKTYSGDGKRVNS